MVKKEGKRVSVVESLDFAMWVFLKICLQYIIKNFQNILGIVDV